MLTLEGQVAAITERDLLDKVDLDRFPIADAPTKREAQKMTRKKGANFLDIETHWQVGNLKGLYRSGDEVYRYRATGTLSGSGGVALIRGGRLVKLMAFAIS